MLSGCRAKIDQIVLPEIIEIKVPVKTEIDKKLTEPCPIYYPDIEKPVKQDIEKALRIQRLLTESCSERFKTIREDL
jgi:hypothetical protein